jgi:beta-mannosidase
LNLIDGWPQFSDAVVHYYFVKKLAFDFIRRAQQPIIAMVREAKGWTHDLVACNDTRAPVALNYVVHELGVDKPLVKGRRIAAADATTVLGTLPYFRKHQRFLVIDWKSDDGKIKGRNHYLAGNPPFSPDDYRRWIKQAYGTDVTKI